MESLNDSDRLTEINENSAQNNEVIKGMKKFNRVWNLKDIYIHVHGERESALFNFEFQKEKVSKLRKDISPQS